LIGSISKSFTITIIGIAVISAFYWWSEPAKAISAFTAVLIITCPCALALSTPFTLGNMLRIFGREKFYIKNAEIIETLANIDTIVFDKTGTITNAGETQMEWVGNDLSNEAKIFIKSLTSNSVHPLSKAVSDFLGNIEKQKAEDYSEITGKGIEALVGGSRIKIGSSSFVAESSLKSVHASEVFVSVNSQVIGKFVIKNSYRRGLKELLDSLKNDTSFAVVSGDNDAESDNLKNIFPVGTPVLFNQKPQDKLDFIKSLQDKGKKVMMIGDGLNDAGALKQSDAGIAISDDINNFSPACDAILDGSRFNQLKTYLNLSKGAKKIILASFTISFLYNAVGLYFAVQGILSPVVAAIIMPLSTITIVLFTTVAGNISSVRAFKN
jgi:P-type Cu+ transporter